MERVLVRVARHDIGLLCSLMAGYEGVAIVRTLDPEAGLVELLVAPAFYTTALDIIRALRQELPLCVLSAQGEGGMESGHTLLRCLEQPSQGARS